MWERDIESDTVPLRWSAAMVGNPISKSVPCIHIYIYYLCTYSNGAFTGDTYRFALAAYRTFQSFTICHPFPCSPFSHLRSIFALSIFHYFEYQTQTHTSLHIYLYVLLFINSYCCFFRFLLIIVWIFRRTWKSQKVKGAKKKLNKEISNMCNFDYYFFRVYSSFEEGEMKAIITYSISIWSQKSSYAMLSRWLLHTSILHIFMYRFFFSWSTSDMMIMAYWSSI